MLVGIQKHFLHASAGYIAQMFRLLFLRDIGKILLCFSKKRNEVLQMLLLDPLYAILDETDSGLDIDALRIVSEGVNSMRSPFRSFLVITHYKRLLDYIRPDVVHVLADGRIVRTGGGELVDELESRGYEFLKEAETAEKA